MPEKKYAMLIKDGTNILYPWNEALAARPDMRKAMMTTSEIHSFAHGLKHTVKITLADEEEEQPATETSQPSVSDATLPTVESESEEKTEAKKFHYVMERGRRIRVVDEEQPS